MDSALKAKTAEYIKTHPVMSYNKFTQVSGIKISDCYYYLIRHDILGSTRTNTRSNSSFKSGGIYINLIAIPSAGLSAETKKVVMDVLKAINTVKGTRIELVENIGEKTLEVRQVGLK